jgi:hypothetical protein
VVLNFYFLLVEMKSVTLAIDRAIDGGLRFSDLTVFLIFCSTKVFHFRRFCKKNIHQCPTRLSVVIPLVDTRSITALAALNIGT